MFAKAMSWTIACARYLSTPALAAALVTLSVSARADWPGLFSKGSGGNNSTSSSTNEAFWGAERPKFGPIRPKIAPPAPARKTPVIFQKVGSGTRSVYNNTLGRVIPKSKPVPVSVTGHNTPWTRNKPKVSEDSGWWPWAKEKDTGPAKSTNEFFQLKRPT